MSSAASTRLASLGYLYSLVPSGIAEELATAQHRQCRQHKLGARYLHRLRG
jgi:hypothetical protein